ncbi:MAG TPA: transposase [Planctomycetota bacterium]|nr:transposase [Planctomycetota bacterium]
MPRGARGTEGGTCYHVLNRGNSRATVFHNERDYEEFLKLMAEACERLEMRVLGFCLMPNHFHMALWPQEDKDLGRWMHWLTTTHVRRHHRRYDSSGHVWQGPYKDFPVQNDRHLATVLRYIERNPLRAGLVTAPRNWPWSSHRWWSDGGGHRFLHPTPAVLNPGWPEVVRQPQTEAELAALRACIRRGRPYGGKQWVRLTAQRLGLESTLRPLGRPVQL